MDIVRILYYVLSFIGARLNVDFHVRIIYNNNLHITVNLIRRAASIEAMVGQLFVIRSRSWHARPRLKNSIGV